MGPRSPFIVLIALVAISFTVFAGLNQGWRTPAVAPPPPPPLKKVNAVAPRIRPAAGESAIAPEDLPFAFSAKLWEELASYATAKNIPAIQRMMSSGKAGQLTAGTRVSVVTVGWLGEGSVRVVDGPLAGELVWTKTESLKRVDPEAEAPKDRKPIEPPRNIVNDLEPGEIVRLTETLVGATSWVMSGRVAELSRAGDKVGLADLVLVGDAVIAPKDTLGRMIVSKRWLGGDKSAEIRIERAADKAIVGELMIVPLTRLRRHDAALPEVARTDPDRNQGHETLEEVRARLPKESAPSNPNRPAKKAVSPKELEGQAERKLRLAEQYHRNGLDNEAMLLVKEILSLYPATPSAEKAADLRKKISPDR